MTVLCENYSPRSVNQLQNSKLQLNTHRDTQIDTGDFQILLKFEGIIWIDPLLLRKQNKSFTSKYKDTSVQLFSRHYRWRNPHVLSIVPQTDTIRPRGFTAVSKMKEKQVKGQQDAIIWTCAMLNVTIQPIFTVAVNIGCIVTLFVTLSIMLQNPECYKTHSGFCNIMLNSIHLSLLCISLHAIPCS